MKVKELKENIRNIVRQKLSEATIDVTNPATETPQTKKAKIDMARRVTGNKNLGTEKDPVEFIEEDNIDESGTGDQPISSMSRADMIKHLGLDPNTSEDEISDDELRDAIQSSIDLDEADYFDPDDEVKEGVDDVDYGDGDFKDYDSIYERMQKLLNYKG